MVDTISSLGYDKKLGKYGFKPTLCTSEYQCEKWINFCKKNNMKWLSGAYGTLVHKDFNNHFIRLNETDDEITEALIELKIIDENYNRLISLNHSNVLKSTINDGYIVTSSPNYISWGNIKKYAYAVYFIHPSLLEDYSLDGDINLAFSNISHNKINEINNAIYEDTGIYCAFKHLCGQWGDF